MKPAEYRGMTDEQLALSLREVVQNLFHLRFQSATGQLESHGRLRAVKRDIARIYTIIRERELGIRATPVVELPVKAEKKTTKAKKDAAVDETSPASEPAETTEETK